MTPYLGDEKEAESGCAKNATESPKTIFKDVWGRIVSGITDGSTWCPAENRNIRK